MKKHLIFLLLFLSLISCTSVNSLMQPDWVTRKPKIVGAVVYVGEGIGSNEEDARDKAYLDVLRQLGENLGYEISSQYLRELLSSDKIVSLSTKITDKYYHQLPNGEWNYFVMAKTNQSTLKNSRSPEYIELIKREERIEKTLKDALKYYQENEDIQSINKVLEAILISFEGDVNNPEYTAEALRARAVEYIDNLRLSLEHPQRKSLGITVKLKRAKGLFYPPVKNASMIATYKMMNINGKVIDSFFKCQTDKTGQFVYTNTNPYILREGDVVFSLSIDSNLIKKIQKVRGEEFVKPLKDAIQEKTITYSYVDNPKLPPENTLIAYALYDEDGNELSSEIFASVISDYLETAKAPSYMVIETTGEEFEDILDDLYKEYPTYRFFVIVRAGIVGYKHSVDDVFTRVEGRVAFYDRTTEEQFAIQDSFMLGSGDSEASAADDALKNAGCIIAGRMLEEI